MSTFIACGAINFKAQCAEGGRVGGGEVGRVKEKVIRIKIKRKTKCTVRSHSENRWVFKRLWNGAKDSASLIVCGSAF